jgi:type II secretory pathway pseudopilin PulG
MHLQRPPFTRCRAAFSVVEMLVVITIVGALSAVVISFYGRYHRDVVLRVRDQRNAQEITSLAMGANAAGADVIAQDDMEQTILNLIEGRNGTTGPFKGHRFGLSNLTADEIEGAMKHLRWHAGFPSYVPEGVADVDAGNSHD